VSLLSHLRVVEIATRVAGPYAGKLLADLGAEVIKLEPPEGDPLRRRPVAGADRIADGAPTFFDFLNTHKRVFRLELARAEGRETFRGLAAQADVLIEDAPLGGPASLGLGYPDIARVNPGLIQVSISAFGKSGPHARYRTQHLNRYHAGGDGFLLPPDPGQFERPPVQGPGFLGDLEVGLTAAVAILAAIRARAQNAGRGDWIDLSAQEAMLALNRGVMSRYVNEGVFEDRRTPSRGTGGLLPCRDGWVSIRIFEPHQWRGLLQILGNPEWARPEWAESQTVRDDAAPEIMGHLRRWSTAFQKVELYHALQANGVPAGIVATSEDLHHSPQLRERDFFRPLRGTAGAETGDADARRILLPTFPYRFDGAPVEAPIGPRDLAGAPVFETARHATAAPSGALAASERPSRPPLAGLRILDFSWAWAGPYATQLAAFLGAEVIRVESRARLDMFRPPRAPEVMMGFQEMNQGKRSVRLNLARPEAREIARQLACLSDVVFENFRPGVLERMGLGYVALRGLRPDLLFCSVSALGQQGPEASYSGYAPTFAALSGLNHLTGYPDREPAIMRAPADLIVATTAAFALLAALEARARDGRGRSLDLSSVEALAVLTAEALVDFAHTGVSPSRSANEDREFFPHDCYRCSGEDAWISIAVGDATEWQALARSIGREDLATDALASISARRACAAEINAAISEWTSVRDKWAATRHLQAAGVPAFPSVSAIDCFADPHLQARGWTREFEHPYLGRLVTLRPPWRFTFTPETPGAPAPTLGQHTGEVLGELLGLQPGEIERLETAQVLY
jgi:crotonobetainyl-CoA:carnitine CoA-transferase CaiB-like acyl-CoA transferase